MPQPFTTRIRPILPVLLLACAVLLAAAAPTVAQTAASAEVTIEDLGTIGGAGYSIPFAINDRGDVVGFATDVHTNALFAFIWNRSTGFRRIGTEADGPLQPTDINNHGEVVGRILKCVADACESWGFSWTRAGGVVDLGRFVPAAINDAGVIAGICEDTGAACLKRPGESIVPIGQGRATGINDAGDTSLNMYGFPARRRADGGVDFLDGSGSRSTFTDDIGADGTVAGTSWRDVPFATMWVGSTRYLADRPWTVANAINAYQQLVGFRSLDATGSHYQAMFWSRATGVVDLGALSAGDDIYSTAIDINGRGDIVGWSLARVGDEIETHAVLWHVTPKLLRITTPNTASRWGLGTTQRLAWTYAGDAPEFQIDISRDSGRTWEPLATVANAAGHSQNFYWRVDGPLTSAAKFRVTAVGDPGATDVNDIDVRIAAATVEILWPSASTSVHYGTTQTISFKHSLGAGAPIAIEVSGDNGAHWRTLAKTRTTGSVTSTFKWIVDLPPTVRARVRVQALDGTRVSAMSSAFTVTAAQPGVGEQTDDGTTLLP